MKWYIVRAFRWCRGTAGGKMISTHLPALGCLNIVVARKRTFPTPGKVKMMPGKTQLRPAVNATRQFREASDQDST